MIEIKIDRYNNDWSYLVQSINEYLRNNHLKSEVDYFTNYIPNNSSYDHFDAFRYTFNKEFEFHESIIRLLII